MERLNVRIHMFFLLFGVVTLYFSWNDAGAAPVAGELDLATLGMMALGILFASVVVHELGHLVVANRMGASLDDLVIGPLGSLGPQPSPLETHGELLVATAGPLANLAFVSRPLFVGDSRRRAVDRADESVCTGGLTLGTPVEQAIKMTFWVNWLLILVNMIPAYPFDGGRALRALFMLTNVNMDHHRAAFAVARVAKFCAVLLAIVAWLNLGAGGQRRGSANLVCAYFTFDLRLLQRQEGIRASNRDSV